MPGTTTTNLAGCGTIRPFSPDCALIDLRQDSENSTILILLADIKPPSTGLYASSDPDVIGSALRMARMYYDRYPFILDWSDSSGRTALHVAALKGNEELVRVCLLPSLICTAISNIHSLDAL